jgi:hypothetical protein
MKHICVLLLSVLFISCAAQKKTVKYEMKQTHPYCGGARPSPEILEKAKIPHPYAGKTLIFISEKGRVDSTKTNTKGLLTVKLTKVTYMFFEPWKYYKKTPDGSPESNYDKSCLEEIWKKEDIKIIVTGAKIEVTNNIENGKCPHQLDCLTNKHLPE